VDGSNGEVGGGEHVRTQRPGRRRGGRPSSRAHEIVAARYRAATEDFTAILQRCDESDLYRPMASAIRNCGLIGPVVLTPYRQQVITH
jgi:hypothetical protein